ncbi:gamma-glutamyl-gamma-aminobutyrate hydrolase family protein [Clostridiaceae bacterium]|nr:gamma-glutamyl-gamma-aminobutyrate hydrolase family protein [Clostridiaceae bacterium]
MLILLTTGRRTGGLSVSRTASILYGEALARAGGLPAAFSGGDPASLAREFSGLLLTGGGDVEPARYGGARLPTDTVDVDRDREEFALLDAFLRQGRPVFGICRGVQLLNVYFGGTLCQQVPGHADGARHTVHAVPGSRIEALCGAAFETNSWHHQAADALAPGLRCTASSPDGLAEALEHEAFPVFGVQWHPERMLPGLCADVDTDHQCLFDDFIKECGAHHE